MESNGLMLQVFGGHDYIFYEDSCTKGRVSE